MADLKPVYRAVSKDAAETALDELEEKWGQQYPVVFRRATQMETCQRILRYPANIRKVIYTNECNRMVHRQFRS